MSSPQFTKLSKNTLKKLTEKALHRESCLFWPLYNAITEAAILTVTYGGWVIASPDCFSATVRIIIAVNLLHDTINCGWFRFTRKRQNTIKRKCLLRHENEKKTALYVWWQNGVKVRFPNLPSLVLFSLYREKQCFLILGNRLT